jgi:hypothetical protein
MADTEREYMAPKGKPVVNTHSKNRQYRPENNRPITNAEDLANDGTQIFHIGGTVAKQPRGKATDMKVAGQNTGQPGTGVSRQRNFLGHRVT